MDIADIGNEVTEQLTSVALARIRANANVVKYPPKGTCYNCDNLVENKPFCDPECRDDFEQSLRRGG